MFCKQSGVICERRELVPLLSTLPLIATAVQNAVYCLAVCFDHGHPLAKAGWMIQRALRDNTTRLTTTTGGKHPFRQGGELKLILSRVSIYCASYATKKPVTGPELTDFENALVIISGS
jgi:hypothetical protein